MIPVVIDTNVFLSALLFGATPGKLISLWKSGPVIIAEDPSDDMFLRCCNVSNGKALISGDSHLLALKFYGNASILTPSQFLREFQEELRA